MDSSVSEPTPTEDDWNRKLVYISFLIALYLFVSVSFQFSFVFVSVSHFSFQFSSFLIRFVIFVFVDENHAAMDPKSVNPGPFHLYERDQLVS